MSRERLANLVEEARERLASCAAPRRAMQSLQRARQALSGCGVGDPNEVTHLALVASGIVAAAVVLHDAERPEFREAIEILLKAASEALAEEEALDNPTIAAIVGRRVGKKAPPKEDEKPHPLIQSLRDAGADETALAGLAKALRLGR